MVSAMCGISISGGNKGGCMRASAPTLQKDTNLAIFYRFFKHLIILDISTTIILISIKQIQSCRIGRDLSF